MFENAIWVQGGEDCQAPLFRREFAATNAKVAKISICGLGYFELYLNGRRVGDDLYVPACSDYQPRIGRKWLYPIHDRFSHRTYYLEYDLLPYLEEGLNALGVVLGNGWYHQVDRTAEGDMDYGLPRLCFSLEITDAQGNTRVIASDETMKWAPSEIVANNIFMGERQDLRLCREGWNRTGYDDSAWEPVRVAAAPETRFFPQTCPPDRVIRTLNPVLVHEDGERRIYDCGENITGYVALRLPDREGMQITVRHSEELNTARNELDFGSAGGTRQIQTDTYISSNQPATCHPRFCWHGFRYFDITGDAQPENPEVAVVHGDIAVTSSFECSDPTLNWLYDAYIRTQLGNLHGGVFSDCPHRERLGYTGDGQVTAEACMLCLDSRTVYDKWLEDIADGQDPDTGHIQHTAPFYGGGGGPGGWGGAIFIVPLAYYRAYGDVEILRRYHPHMRRWLDYMESRTDGGLVTREEEGGWCLGEWCTPVRPIEIPEPFVNTYYYIRGLRAVRDIGALLGDTADQVKNDRRLAQTESAFMAAFFDKSTGSFCRGVNAADAFAVDLGLGDERTLAALIEKYTRTKTFDTGIFGTDILVDVLFRHQQADLAYTLLTRETEASFARMRKAGATTLWEHWSGGSHNHPMFGGVVRSLFRYILGIGQADGSAGYSDVVIQPAAIAGLSWAKGWITTPVGKISVDCEKDTDGKLIVKKNVEPVY